MNLADLAKLGITATAKAGELRLRAARGVITAELGGRIRAVKPDLLRELGDGIGAANDSAGPRLDDLDPAGGEAGERILRALKTPAPAARLTRTNGDRPEVGTFTLPAHPGASQKHAYRWLIHFADREPQVTGFSPELTHAEVLHRFPTAIAAEPIDQPSSNAPADSLSEREIASLRAWLDSIGERDPAIIAHLLNQCRCDIKTRRYFLQQASSATESIAHEMLEERAAIRGYDGGYSQEMRAAASEMAQAAFAGRTPREWLARYAPERLPEGDKPENRPGQ